MRKNFEILLEKHQVRRTKKQKQEFGNWMTEYLSEYGYDVSKHEYSKSGTNLMVGDAELAEIILTAHYDTPPDFLIPQIMGFSNWGFFIISQMIIFLPFLFLLGLNNWVLFNDLISDWLLLPLSLLPLLYLFQLSFGIPCKNTANDNTSGVATLISILEEMPERDRAKVCVVFFDEEEMGLIGSSNFHKKYKPFLEEKPLINFDCVSDGETFVFISKKKFRNSKYYEPLKMATDKAIKGSEKQKKFMNALQAPFMSDQVIFPQGVGVVSAKKVHILGYYINRIHSKWDTKFDEENIKLLTNTILQFVQYCEGEKRSDI